jgi:hypothetical protein
MRRSRRAIVSLAKQAARYRWRAMKTPTVRDRLEGLGAVIVSQDRATPDYLAQFVKGEIEKWAGPIKASGVTVE